MKDDNNVLDKEITDINTLKKEKVKTMPKNLIESYVKIYQKKQGSGIALIKEGKCNVCNMTLPKQICNEISKKDKIIYCPSCQRIVISIDI
jgi:predicted  nucleic acid-binding Zn-ribbon protein